MKLEYAYVVTCENLDGTNVKVSGACYHEFDNALKYIESRADKPVQTENLMIWESKTYIYKIIPLTFDDKRVLI